MNNLLSPSVQHRIECFLLEIGSIFSFTKILVVSASYSSIQGISNLNINFWSPDGSFPLYKQLGTSIWNAQRIATNYLFNSTSTEGYHLEKNVAHQKFQCFEVCKRTATSISLSASSFATGLASPLSEFQTFSRSSRVFASAKGFRLFFSSFMFQIYTRITLFHNRNDRFLPHLRLSLGEFFAWGIRSLRRPTEFFFWNYNHRLLCNSPLRGSFRWVPIYAFGFPGRRRPQTELSHLGNLRPFGSILKNLFQCPYRNFLFFKRFPEELDFPRRFHFGTIQLDPIYESDTISNPVEIQKYRNQFNNLILENILSLLT